MKISLNKELIKHAPGMTPLQLSKITGISSRPTIYQMVAGTWSPQFFSLLARFLIGLGFTAKSFGESRVDVFFHVEEDKPEETDKEVTDEHPS